MALSVKEKEEARIEAAYLQRQVIEAEIAKSVAERQVLELRLEEYMVERRYRQATGNPIGNSIAKREYPWEKTNE